MDNARENQLSEALADLPADLVKNDGRKSADEAVIQALPPPPAGIAGSSSASGKHYEMTVSNKAGYLCHVHVIATWPVGPEVPFTIFTHPDNSALFRDIRRVGSRKVIKTEPGYKEVQVEQVGEIQVLWIHRTYSTWLHVIEDARDPECLRTSFHLVKSDVLGKFSGEWELRPVRDPATGKVVGCRGELHQDVLPKGMPVFMARLPVLGGALRGISVRAVARVMEDFNAVMDKVLAGHAAGRSTETVMRELCGPVSEAAHANGAVASFAFDPNEEEEDEEQEGAEGKAERGEQEAGKEGAVSAVGPAVTQDAEGAEEAKQPVEQAPQKAQQETAAAAVSASPDDGGMQSGGVVHVVAEAVTGTGAAGGASA